LTDATKKLLDNVAYLLDSIAEFSEEIMEDATPKQKAEIIKNIAIIAKNLMISDTIKIKETKKLFDILQKIDGKNGKLQSARLVKLAQNGDTKAAEKFAKKIIKGTAIPKKT
jgi:hypothetical protein